MITLMLPLTWQSLPTVFSVLKIPLLWQKKNHICNLKEHHKPPNSLLQTPVEASSHGQADLQQLWGSNPAQAQHRHDGKSRGQKGRKVQVLLFKRKRLSSKNGQGATEPGASRRCRRKPIPQSSGTKVKWFRCFLPAQLNTEEPIHVHAFLKKSFKMQSQKNPCRKFLHWTTEYGELWKTGAVQTYPATQELQSPTPKFSSLGLKSHLDSAHGVESTGDPRAGVNDYHKEPHSPASCAVLPKELIPVGADTL